MSRRPPRGLTPSSRASGEPARVDRLVLRGYPRRLVGPPQQWLRVGFPRRPRRVSSREAGLVRVHWCVLLSPPPSPSKLSRGSSRSLSAGSIHPSTWEGSFLKYVTIGSNI